MFFIQAIQCCPDLQFSDDLLKPAISSTPARCPKREMTRLDENR